VAQSNACFPNVYAYCRESARDSISRGKTLGICEIMCVFPSDLAIQQHAEAVVHRATDLSVARRRSVGGVTVATCRRHLKLLFSQ
jgi:hypothetical protein